MQIVRKGGIRFVTEIMADPAQGKVHFCQAIGRRLFFLPVYVDPADVPAFCFHQLRALDEHTARTAAGIVQRAVKRFDHSCNKLYNVVRRIILALFFCRVDGKFFEKVFVHSSDKVFFFTERLVADLVDLVNDLFDVVGRQVARGKSAFHKAAFQRLTVGYGWSGESVKLLQEKLTDAGFEVIDENIRSQWNPEDVDFAGIPSLVTALIGKSKGVVK